MNPRSEAKALSLRMRALRKPTMVRFWKLYVGEPLVDPAIAPPIALVRDKGAVGTGR